MLEKRVFILNYWELLVFKYWKNRFNGGIYGQFYVFFGKTGALSYSP